MHIFLTLIVLRCLSLIVLSFGVRGLTLQPRLACNSQTPVSVSCVLGLQACVVTPDLCPLVTSYSRCHLELCTQDSNLHSPGRDTLLEPVTPTPSPYLTEDTNRPQVLCASLLGSRGGEEEGRVWL